MRHNIVAALVCVALFTACVEAAGEQTTPPSPNTNLSIPSPGPDAVTVVEIDTSPAPASSLKDEYEVSGFSSFVFFHKEDGSILVDLNFFPGGSDLCQQATYDEKKNPQGCKQEKTMAIPCEYQTLAGHDDPLTVNINAASEDTSCQNEIIVDLSETEFTTEGIVFPEDPIDVFADEFEFTVNRTGFVDVKDNQPVSFDSKNIGLEEVYDKIMDKRTE